VRYSETPHEPRINEGGPPSTFRWNEFEARLDKRVIKFGGERPTIIRLNESAAGIASLFAPRERRHSLIGRLLGRE
jgi:hypothetical protein